MSNLNPATRRGLSFFLVTALLAGPACAASAPMAPDLPAAKLSGDSGEVSGEIVSAMTESEIRAKIIAAAKTAAIPKPGFSDPLAFGEVYPIPEPEPAAVTPEPAANKALYWIGGTGAALVAGVAAYLIFSEDSKNPSASAVIP
jgi:hypothetical protein